MKLHRRQFVIGPRALEFNATTETLLLSNGLYLSYDDELRVTVHDDRLLIGDAFSTIDGRYNLDLISGDDFDFPRDSEAWTGRWLFCQGDELYSDVTTSLAVFCAEKQGTEFWLSSSAALLASVDSSLQVEALVYQEKNHLPPTSCIEGIEQLLIGERVNLHTGVREWQGFAPVMRVDASEAELLERIGARLVVSAKALLNTQRPVRSAITSGKDSRLDLSALLAAKSDGAETEQDFATYTFVKEALLMNPGDRKMPMEMSAKLGFNHCQIKPVQHEPANRGLYSAHCWTARSTEPGSPLYFFENNLWQQLPYGCFNVDHCYEIGRNFLFDCGQAGQREGFGYEDLLADNYVQSEAGYARMDACFAKIIESSQIDRRNLLYLYKSYPFFGRLYQAQDVWVDSLFIGNSREIFSLLLSVADDDRMSGCFHERLVASIYAQLDAFPYNPSTPLWQKLLVKVISRIKR